MDKLKGTLFKKTYLIASILNNMDNTFFEQLRLEQKLFWNWQKLKLQYGYPKLYYSLMIAYTWLKIQKMKIEQWF